MDFPSTTTTTMEYHLTTTDHYFRATEAARGSRTTQEEVGTTFTAIELQTFWETTMGAEGFWQEELNRATALAGRSNSCQSGISYFFPLQFFTKTILYFCISSGK